MRVLIADEVDKECPARLRAAGFEVSERFDISAEELKKVVGDYEVLIVRSRTKVAQEIIESGKKLRLIGRVGVGLDTIDTKAADLREEKCQRHLYYPDHSDTENHVRQSITGPGDGGL